MKTYILLFRGINVGGNNILPMKSLVELLEKNHHKNIRTYIQSGNVILESSKRPDSEVGILIKQDFGFEPILIALEESEFIQAVQNNPFPSNGGKTVHFYFCKNIPKVDETRIEKCITDSEQYYIENKVFYLHAPDGIGRSKLASNVESCLGVSTTARNLNTVNKLQSMLQD